MLILNKNQIFKLDFVAVFIARYKFQSNLVDSILTMSMWAIDIENYSMLMYAIDNYISSPIYVYVPLVICVASWHMSL